MQQKSMFKPAARVEHIVKSEIRNMTDECERRGGINLSQGVCDLPLSEVIREAACQAIRDGVNSYTNHRGIMQLRRAIARKAAGFNQIDCNETNVIVSAGATGALYCALLATLSPGDEIVLFEPYYGYHVNTIHAVGAVPVYLRLAANSWEIDYARLEALVSPRTKALLINTPANPSGKIFSRPELQTLGTFCRKHNLMVFTDEIYEYFTYDGRPHVSPAALPELSDRTITISGFSKVFSITGWRIGYCLAPAVIAEAIGHISDLVYVCAPAPLQAGVAGALEQLGAGYYSGLAATYRTKRDKLCLALREAGLPPCVPQGAYYILADASRLGGATAKDKAMRLLDTTGVASVPGEAFYHDGEANLLRFCFAKDDKILDAACQALQNSLPRTG